VEWFASAFRTLHCDVWQTTAPGLVRQWLVMTAQSLSEHYSETLIEHFEHPRNAGAMVDADVEGFVTNPVCGDSMRLFLRIESETRETGAGQERVAAASFLTSGCPASIATSSVATEIIAGLTLPEAEALTREDYANAIGGLPKSKQHCSVLARAAVRAAIENWRASRPAGEAANAGP